MANFIKIMLKPSFLTNQHYIHTSTCLNGQAKVMRKILKATVPKKKFRYIETPILPSAAAFTKGANEGSRSTNTKRVAVLNKLFMRYITDLMATGDNASEFIGHGIEINRVQVTPDYKLVKVYWFTKFTQKDNLIGELLKKAAGPLRHELTQLRVIGVVPKLQFIKDNAYAKIAEIDLHLSKIDFGEDYVPMDPAAKLKTEFQLHIPLQPETKEKILSIDKETVIDDDDEKCIPEMPQNVLGLNHADIMEKIKKSLKKSRASHRLSVDSKEVMQYTQTLSENPINFEDNKIERENFKKFLQKREILRSKAKRADKNSLHDMECIKENFIQNEEEYFENLDYFIEENDFIEELDEFDEKK